MQSELQDFQEIGQGNLHIVYKYVGQDPQLIGKVFRVTKPKQQCPLSVQLLPIMNQMEWTPLKKYFVPRIPFQWQDIQGELLDNLFHNVEFAVEIKPKTFLPILSNQQVDKDIKNITNGRFFMIQLMKVSKKLSKQGKSIYDATKNEIDALMSKYDPRRFFSGKIEDLKQAINQLIETPENNFQVINQCISNEDIIEIIATTLINEDIIGILWQYFLVLTNMNVTVEESLDTYEELKQRGVTEAELQQLLTNPPMDLGIILFKLLQFSSFQALSDLSIIGSFRKEGPGKQIELNGQQYYYTYRIVDCDLKPFTKILDYNSTVSELLKLSEYYRTLS